MRNLFAFLYRSRIFILFLALEIIAFIWISNSRSFQRTVMFNSANGVSGFFLQKAGNFNDYFHLGEQNERLSQENARLRSLLPQSYYLLDSTFSAPVDSAYLERYKFIAGEVISSSFQKSRNYMTITLGKAQGIKPEMGVISSDGVVGIVNDVSEHFATVIPIINPLFRVSGRIKSSGYFGPVIWKNNNYQYAYLTDIPRYANIEKGDTVVTDSRSNIFPPGIPIGIIDTFQLQEDQNFYEVKLKLASDFSSIGYIYVVKDKMKAEVQQLEDKQDQ